MNPEDINNTDREAYGMAFSVALDTLNRLMTQEDTDPWVRLYAAEAVLENEPTRIKKDAAASTDN